MSNANLSFQQSNWVSRQTPTDLVMAWAREAATGEPRNILELGADCNGARSGCECRKRSLRHSNLNDSVQPKAGIGRIHDTADAGIWQICIAQPARILEMRWGYWDMESSLGQFVLLAVCMAQRLTFAFASA